MEETTRETVTTREGDASSVAAAPVEKEATGNQTAGYVIYFILGVIEVLLAFRFVLKLAGASTGSGFVSFIYGITGFFIAPFEGIFRRGLNQGIETTSVFEPSTFTAIIVYALVAWGIVKLIQIASGKKQPTE